MYQGNASPIPQQYLTNTSPIPHRYLKLQPCSCVSFYTNFIFRRMFYKKDLVCLPDVYYFRLMENVVYRGNIPSKTSVRPAMTLTFSPGTPIYQPRDSR